MKEWLKKVMPWGSIVPAVVLLICIQISVGGYTAPVFEVQAVEEVTEELTEELEEEKKNDSARETEDLEEKEQKKETEASGEYKDGIYYGTAKGYRGQIKVAVTIENGKIKDISVSETSDDAAFFGRAKALLAQIVEKQSTNVDTVSGATYSSVGLIQAVRNALKEAGMKVEGEDLSLPAADSISQPAAGAEKTLEKAKDPSKYKNGTYYGTGTGFAGTIKVKVVIKNGKIKKITVEEFSDDAGYFNRAKAVLDKIIKKQGTDVDTVSGATYSSTGLIHAVRDALEDADGTKKKSEKKKSGKKKKKQKKEQKQETEEQPETNPETAEGTFPYKDGVYYGTGEGYRGDITVAVTISNKTIQNIQITSAEDDQTFLSKAKAILEQVKQRQNTDVDVVSGATFSSRGILEAVNNALLEAKRATEEGPAETENTEKETEETEKTTEGSSEKESERETETETDTETQVYADGNYAAEAGCEPDSNNDFASYQVAVLVTIADGKVAAVTDIQGTGNSYDVENDWYLTRAANGTKKYPGVIAQIIEKGTADGIDAVSGATCSSGAIVAAVKKAFEMAKTGETK